MPKKNRVPGVFKRGEKWSYKIWFTDTSGRNKQLWRGGFDTQAEAAAERTDALARRNSGVDISPQRTTVTEYLERWLLDYASQLKRSTAHGYRALLTHHVIPQIGDVKLSKLRPLQVQSVYSAMRVKGLSEKTILNCHRALSEALKQAVRWELRPDNPTEKVASPRPSTYNPVIMRIDQVQEAIDLAPDDVRGALIRFALYSGMRQGELLRLQWPHVDFSRSIISIPSSKSQAGERALLLSAAGVEILRQHRYRQMQEKLQYGPAYRDEAYVFARPDGLPLTAMQASWTWSKIRKQIGTTARFHDLRHTNASLLLAAGAPMKLVQEWLGHASYQVTADIYSHLIPGLELNEQVAGRLDALLARPDGSNLVAGLGADELN